MKRLLLAALVLMIPSQAPAQGPRMTVREENGSNRILRIEQADVSVRFLGDIAETVFDLCFRNDGERAVEGEFALPLPEGATVSAYALEVNGKLRDGVAVERQRARNAYESIKRRMIDPGLVEREAGNTYRTNVYPVPAKGTKRLRISYTETLRPDAEGLAYALPLAFSDSVDSFSCKLRGTAAGNIRVLAAAGLEFATNADGELGTSGRDVRPAGILKLLVTPPTGPQMILENDPQAAFLLSDRVPELATRPRPAPARVMLVWDASASGLERDHTAELGLLESWFSHLGATRVSLRLLRERLEDGGEYEISGGRWPKLKKVLKQVDYDGGTALSCLHVDAGQADLVVLVGDGVATLGQDAPQLAVPLVFIHCGTSAPPQALVRLSRSSGGTAIDLATDSKAEALAKLIRQPLRLIAVKGVDVATTVLEQDLQPGRLLRIFGTLREPHAGKLELCYGYGNDITVTREVVYQPGGQPGGVVRRLHAQRVLAELEQQDPRNPGQIIEHCMRNGLVSDYTSLIVLERIEDYVAYRIPPPEPELLAEFHKRVAAQAQQESTARRGLAWAWALRLHEYEHRLPGHEAVLLPRLRQIGIWKSAVESQFAPGQRDAAAFATVAGWFDQASALIVRKPALQTKEEYTAWRQAVGELHAQGPKLAQTPLHLPPAGQNLTVSVRGLVAKPGLVAGEPGMTLRQAIDKAGGLHPFGGLDNVALYRNGGKIVYNTLSARYQDTQLFPGDMLVVGQPGPPNYNQSDPFDEHFEPPDPSKDEPIRETGDVWPVPEPSHESFEPPDRDVFDGSSLNRGPMPLRRATPWDLGGVGFATPATPSGHHRAHGYSPPQLPNQTGPAPPEPSASSEITASPHKPAAATTTTTTAVIKPAKTEPLEPPHNLTVFAGELAAGRDAEAAYRALKGRHLHESAFYVEAARMLFARHQVDLARRVLSNLTELQPGDVAALRSYAWWLAEFGQVAEADAVLCTVPSQEPAAMQVLLDRALILVTSGSEAAAAEVLTDLLGRIPADESGRLAAMALTEFNALYRRLKGPARPHPLGRNKDEYRRNLDADLRIVVCSSAFVRLQVSDTGGFPALDPAAPCGERITADGRMHEYLLRHAEPGIYQIKCAAGEPATVRAVIHRNWGRPDHTFKVVTILLDGRGEQSLGEVEIEFQAAKRE